MTVEPPPFFTEALDRLRGRRADAIVEQSRVRVVAETQGQNRKTRRANLARLRAEVRAQRKARAAGVLVT